MKLVLFDDYRPGVLVGETVFDISDEVELGRSGQETMVNIITDWDSIKPELERKAAQARGVPLASVRLRAPLPKPGKIMCMAANYRENTDKPALPIDGFLVSPEAVMDPGGTTILPPYDFAICHHEAELVAVIGKKGRHLSQAEAMGYVFGYTAGVDVSARGLWGRLSKAFDGFIAARTLRRHGRRDRRSAQAPGKTFGRWAVAPGLQHRRHRPSNGRVP